MGIGILVTVVSYPVMYAILGGTLVLSMFATLFSFRDPHVPQVARWRKPARRVCFHMVKPFCFAPFTWVVVTRSLNVMGMYTVQEFLLYYFTDIGAPYPIAGAELQSPALATALVTMTLLVGAAVISLPSGWLSDRIGRRAICMIAAVVQGIVALIVGYVYDFQMFLGLGVLFGFGYGAFVSVEWGLASDVLPSTREHAKDIGVWHLSLTVPQGACAAARGDGARAR
jgi:Na+/melibiose symporter-like transporter